MISAVSSTSHLKAPPIYSVSTGARSSTRVKAFYAPAVRKETLYQVLGIAENGTVSEIKRAYKEMARKYHPDVSAPEIMDEHTKRFILVHEAYQTLSDPQTRALYDQNLTTGDDDHERMEVQREWWRIRWQSQLDELHRRRRMRH